MPFEKGQSGNPNGRPKGTPNRLTKDIQTILKNALYDEFEKLPELLQQLEPKQRADVIIKLSKYCLPSIVPEQIEDDFWAMM